MWYGVRCALRTERTKLKEQDTKDPLFGEHHTLPSAWRSGARETKEAIADTDEIRRNK